MQALSLKTFFFLIFFSLFFLSSCTKDLVGLRIQNVTIDEFPALSGTSSWDFTGGPDIYLAIMQNGTMMYQSFSNIQDADATRPHSFNEVNLLITDLEAEYELWLLDADFPDEDDFIGKVTFQPSNKIKNDILQIQEGGMTITVEVEPIRN